MLVVEQHISVQRGFQLFAGTEVVALQHLLNAAVETLDHAIGLGVLRRSKAVFDAEVGAELIELVLAGGSALAQAEQAVGELLAIIRENGPDPHRAGPFEIAQEPAGIRGGLGLVDANEDPAGRPVDGDEQVAPRGFVRHLRQILHVHMQVTGLVGLESLVFRSRCLRLQIAQIAHPMPTEAAVQP